MYHEEANMANRIDPMDIREMPAYGLVEISEYLDVPKKTIEYWTTGGESPLIHLPRINPPRFSFMNLLECHILSSMRGRGLSLQRVRTSLEWINTHSHSDHPLIDKLFQTDGVDLFIQEIPDKLITVSRGGQFAFREILEIFLERIELDLYHIAARFFPFVAEVTPNEPKIIQIDPNICFGRPVISGTGITTAIIASRFAARETIADLSMEYGRTQKEIEEAIRWENKAA
jgi:uncharacterized protein (DUF433 family)